MGGHVRGVVPEGSGGQGVYRLGGSSRRLRVELGSGIKLVIYAAASRKAETPGIFPKSTFCKVIYSGDRVPGVPGVPLRKR